MSLLRHWKKALLGGLLALLALGAWATWEVQRTLTLPADFAEVHVAAGTSVRGIAAQLLAAGVPLRPWAFVLAADVAHASRTLRAGRYRIEHETSVLALVDKFRRGDVEREQLTIVEGTRFADLRRQLAESDQVRHDTRDWSDARVLHELGAPQAQGEGLFAPDTYTFDPDASDLEIYRMAFRAQQERLARGWEGRDGSLPYKEPYEALIMASIIEKETGQAQERGLVAAVFVNRQRRGMPLQTDPTVIYGLGSAYQGRLHKRDLQQDTPYNTYTRAGLPPTPICLPGRDALDAALHPQDSPALYFVARGDGSSVFSASLDEHNRAVERYQRGGAKRATQ